MLRIFAPPEGLDFHPLSWLEDEIGQELNFGEISADNTAPGKTIREFVNGWKWVLNVGSKLRVWVPKFGTHMGSKFGSPHGRSMWAPNPN